MISLIFLASSAIIFCICSVPAEDVGKCGAHFHFIPSSSSLPSSLPFPSFLLSLVLPLEVGPLNLSMGSGERRKFYIESLHKTNYVREKWGQKHRLTHESGVSMGPWVNMTPDPHAVYAVALIVARSKDALRLRILEARQSTRHFMQRHNTLLTCT